MGIKTNVGVFSIYHEDLGKIMRCVYDSATQMVVGYVDMPESDSEEAREEYLKKIKTLKDDHTSWAATATLKDVINIVGTVTGRTPSTDKGEV